jgi:hypothetical protein
MSKYRVPHRPSLRELIDLSRAHWVASLNGDPWRVYVWVSGDLVKVYEPNHDESWGVESYRRLSSVPNSGPSATLVLESIAEVDKMRLPVERPHPVFDW